MAFQMRKETKIERIRTLLDLSGTTIMAIFVSFLLMGISGVVLPFILKIWNQVWIWLSIVLMVFVFFWMMGTNDRTYKTLRKLAGMPYMQGNKEFPPEPAASDEEIAAHIRKISTHQLVIVGYIIPAIVLWLMVFKPF